MGKNTDHVSHIKSKNKVNGKPQLPSPSKLVEGEIAINYAENVETLSIKNESGNVITFSSDNYYTEQKLGSGFTGINSANTVTSVIEHNEEVTSAALNDLNTNKTDVSAFTAHTASTVHMNETEKTNLDSLATNIAAISGITSQDITNWNTGAGVDLSNYYKKSETSGVTELSTAFNDKLSVSDFNTYSGSVDTLIGNKASQGDLNSLSGTVTAHTTDTDIHVTSSDKTAWNAKQDAFDNADVLSGITSTKVSDWDNAITSVTTSSTNGNVSVDGSDVSVYVHPTTAGNKHIPSGGSDGQFLGYDSDGTAKWVNNPNTNRTIKVDGADFLTDASTPLNLSGGTNITLTTGDTGFVIVSATDTTYSSGTAAQLSGGTDTTNRVWSAKNLKDGMDAVYSKITDVEEMEQTLAAGISDVNERMAEKSALNSLASTVNDVKTNGISSRRLARKDFTSYGLPWFISTLKKAVADQDLEKYGMKVGDYISATHDGKTYNYVIAGLNTMRGSIANYRVTQSHVGIIVDTDVTHAWNTNGNTYQSQNSYSTGGTWTTGTAGQGYANCDLHYYLTTTVLSNVEGDLGSANLLSHNKLYGNSINQTGYNRYGSNGGCTNSWAWYTNQKICALSEIQVYGSIVWSSSGYDTGEACRQLDVFRVYNMNEIFEGRYPWLRDVASASHACFVNDTGHAHRSPASHAYYVAALILFA